MKKMIAVLAAAAAVLCMLAACGQPKPEQLLAGKWSSQLGSLEFQGYEFTPSEEDPLMGTVKLNLGTSNLVSGEYVIIPAVSEELQDEIKISYTLWMVSTTRRYYFTVDETTLTMQDEKSSLVLNYTREGIATEGTTG